MQPTLIDQGLNLMLFGMGTVFVFLTLLVFATGLMSRLVMRIAPAAEESSPTAASDVNTPSPQVMAAIRMAIEKHRQS